MQAHADKQAVPAARRACLPSGVRISLCWRAGAPLEMKPTRREVTPSASCFLMICAGCNKPDQHPDIEP